MMQAYLNAMMVMAMTADACTAPDSCAAHSCPSGSAARCALVLNDTAMLVVSFLRAVVSIPVSLITMLVRIILPQTANPYYVTSLQS